MNERKLSRAPRAVQGSANNSSSFLAAKHTLLENSSAPRKSKVRICNALQGEVAWTPAVLSLGAPEHGAASGSWPSSRSSQGAGRPPPFADPTAQPRRHRCESYGGGCT
ncbi:hypothetical protein HaLaN_06697 [Haematococcus lacustris]|uniref:Uncharacterized protein n=1 Tax=Haematococcus lacustris TaxID=44745 RepID=A0A699YU53_HAELA|nr:hypothetical protein HaLaN_06697 [Haematococcus lacustris]